jgi:hypothetical protein
MQSNSTEVKEDCHISCNCLTYSVKAAVLQTISLLCHFLAIHNASSYEDIERQFCQYECESDGKSILQKIIDHVPPNDDEDDIELTNLVKELHNIKININGGTITLDEIYVDIVNGELSLDSGPNKIPLSKVTSPLTNDEKFNLALSTFAWFNFYKKASREHDALVQFYTMDMARRPELLLSYLAIRFWDRNPNLLARLEHITPSIYVVFQDESNEPEIGQRKFLIFYEQKIDLEVIRSIYPKDNSSTQIDHYLECVEKDVVSYFRIDYQKFIGEEEEQHYKIVFRPRFYIFTCVIAFLGLGAAAYLFLGNFLFNKILPFHGVANYIFTGIIGPISIFLIVISIIRTCNACKSHDDITVKNSDYVLVRESDKQEPSIPSHTKQRDMQ